MSTTRKHSHTFELTWTGPTGFPGLLSEVNNQPMGKRFMLTAFTFFLIGGVLALLMRVQLSVSNNTFLGPQVYNQIFTMHGSTMMFLFAVPFLEGLALYLLPLMLGARDVAYPRLTAFGYWLYLFGGIVFYASFAVGLVPDAGWFSYTPLSGPRFSGSQMDFWLLGLSLVEIAGLTAAAEIVVTILKFRAPGMTLSRMPLFAWAMLVTGVMIIFAFTVLLLATVLLELDRTLATKFFHPERGGSSLLWQHLFWFFGHPEVYIMFIPATGIISSVVPVFARRRIAGYGLIVVAIIVTGFVSFGLWVHHMFTTGLPELSLTFFTAASLMIAIASGTQIFAWIATLWSSVPHLTVPLFYALGFIVVFVFGGMTGVMIATVPFNQQVHDSFFIVAHFHYVLIGGVVFPVFAGVYYWFPKISGRLLSPMLGKWSFWLTFIGFNLTFFPMHLMGFRGLPRRVYTYASEMELDELNVMATAGTLLLALGVGFLLVDVLLALRRGRPAGPNPWESDTLEWSVSSPPPKYSFLRPPAVVGRHALWDEKAAHGERDPTQTEPTWEAVRDTLTGTPAHWRATLVTDALDANPQAIQALPGPTYVPLWAAGGVVLAAVGVLAKAYLLAAGGAIVGAGALFVWLRPDDERLELIRTSRIEEQTGLPVLPTGSYSTAWWGMVALLTMIATAFSALFYAYFYIRLYSSVWPQDHLPRPLLWLPSVAFTMLIATAGAQFWAVRGFHAGAKKRSLLGLAGLVALGLGYAGVQVFEWSRLDFGPRINAYASLYYILPAAMLMMVLVGLVLAGTVLVRLYYRFSNRDGFLQLQMQITSLYWYGTVILGVLVYATVYVSPYVV